MVQNSLYSAGIIAIPIKDDNFTSAKPNFLVITTQEGWIKNHPFENPITKEIENKTCVNIYISFSLRSTWDNGSLQEMSFPILKPQERIPVETLNLLVSHEVLLSQEQTVNAFLDLFDFKGGSQLAGFKPVLDTDKCSAIIEDIETREDIINIREQGFITMLEVDNYLSAKGKSKTEYLKYSEFASYYGTLRYVEVLPTPSEEE